MSSVEWIPAFAGTNDTNDFYHQDTKALRNSLDNGGGISLIIRGAIIDFRVAFDSKRWARRKSEAPREE